jgi:flagellar biosynthesis/type III secretory pathway protein FliH
MISERVDSWTQEWLRQGMQQGIQQGLQQGMRDGQALVLRDLLEQRFGVLPSELVERIEQAGLDQLRGWFTRILTAQSLAAVFSGQ